MTGCNESEIEIKESVIKNAVGIRRALQILAVENKSPRSNSQSYPAHLKCKKDPENKRKFNPWAIEKSSTQKIGSKPATIRSNNGSEFVTEISNYKKSKILPTIKSLCSPQYKERVEVEIFVYR